ncbi:hypothetical protein [Spirillospora albida]|uniref:hypothetical protein n=1 Tax=Spirillospora albida TaxID=58123 RepID=UPI0004C22105|nr:hypothetical protein [Spirillospora albida]
MKKRLTTAGVLSLAVGGVLFGASAAMADPNPNMIAVQHCSAGGPAVTVSTSGAFGIVSNSNNCGHNTHMNVQQCSSGGPAVLVAGSGAAGITGHSNGCGNNPHVNVQQHHSSHSHSHSSHSSYSSYSSHSGHGHEHTVVYGGDGFDDEDCPFLDDEDTGNDCPDDNGNGGTPGKRSGG